MPPPTREDKIRSTCAQASRHARAKTNLCPLKRRGVQQRQSVHSGCNLCKPQRAAQETRPYALSERAPPAGRIDVSADRDVHLGFTRNVCEIFSDWQTQAWAHIWIMRQSLELQASRN
eukprot:2779905-Pleurochrysis_carterae.AAC.1